MSYISSDVSQKGYSSHILIKLYILTSNVLYSCTELEEITFMFKTVTVLFLLTVDMMMTRNSCPWNSSTEPTLISDRPTLCSSTRIFSH